MKAGQLVTLLEFLSQGGNEMVLSEVFDLFVKQSPVAVMVRATMENVLSAERLDQLFGKPRFVSGRANCCSRWLPT